MRVYFVLLQRQVACALVSLYFLHELEIVSHS